MLGEPISSVTNSIYSELDTSVTCTESSSLSYNNIYDAHSDCKTNPECTGLYQPYCPESIYYLCLTEPSGAIMMPSQSCMYTKITYYTLAVGKTDDKALYLSNWLWMFIILSVLILAPTIHVFARGLRNNLNLLSHEPVTEAELKKIKLMKWKPEMDITSCVICLDEFVEGDTLRSLPCRHTFHSACVDHWLLVEQRRCPICKQDIKLAEDLHTKAKSHVMKDNAMISAEYIRNSECFFSHSTLDTSSLDDDIENNDNKIDENDNIILDLTNDHDNLIEIKTKKNFLAKSKKCRLRDMKKHHARKSTSIIKIVSSSEIITETDIKTKNNYVHIKSIPRFSDNFSIQKDNTGVGELELNNESDRIIKKRDTNIIQKNHATEIEMGEISEQKKDENEDPQSQSFFSYPSSAEEYLE